MIPTIDFSLIGCLVLVWQFLQTVWKYFCDGLNWITQRALALMIGSRLWATVFFVGFTVWLYTQFTGYLSSWLGVAAGSFFDSQFSASGLSQEFKIVNQVLPVSKAVEISTYGAGLISGYITVASAKMWISKLYVALFSALNSWKT